MTAGDRIKVLITQKRYHPNSIGIVRGLKRRGHDVHILVHGKGSPTEDYTDVEPVRIPYGRLSSSLLRLVGGSHTRNRYAIPSMIEMWSAIRRCEPDVVILKKGRLPNLIAGVMAALVGSRRVLLTNDPPRSREKWWRALLLSTGVLPSVLIATSARCPGALGMDKGNGAWYRPYPIELPSNARKPREHGEPLKLLMVGKFSSERKRLIWLVEAATKAGLDPDTTRLTIVGTGREDGPGPTHLRETAARLGWADALTLHFNVPQGEMSAIYRDHDVFVMTARDEPFGMVVTEAMAHGLAVISSDTVGGSDCITHGKNGFVYSTDDCDELAAYLLQLAGAPELVDRIGADARKTIAEQCSPEAFARLIESLAN